ncbi:MAG: DUF3857 domain-containing protein [Sphingobacteriaceae bacterium]|nr:MAG: DUF3857 domain-containing protein [Sphingobacteriaceae bacterium]
MIKIFTSMVALLLSEICCAQVSPPKNAIQPFGKISQADLTMAICDFEKDANAMVLFDSANIFFDQRYQVVMDVHKRIKIFNNKGTDAANIRIEYNKGASGEMISDIQAETINLNNDKIEMTKIDRKSIYTEIIDKNRQAVVFSFPQVKPGTVIEYQYRWISPRITNIPGWFFQSRIPTRYSQLETTIPTVLNYNKLLWVNQPFVTNTESIKAMANVPSLNHEPYISSMYDNLNRVSFQLARIDGYYGYTTTIADTWEKVGKELVDYSDFGGQMNKKLTNESVIIAKAKLLKTNEEKVAYIFNQVKNALKWNHIDVFYADNGVIDAWDKKTGNSTEINLILYHLLKAAGLNVQPMLVSTRPHGKINPAYPNYYQFNRAVVFMPVDSSRNWVLDATNKNNCYKQTPEEVLNGFGLCMRVGEQKSELIYLQETTPARQEVIISLVEIIKYQPVIR